MVNGEYKTSRTKIKGDAYDLHSKGGSPDTQGQHKDSKELVTGRITQGIQSRESLENKSSRVR